MIKMPCFELLYKYTEFYPLYKVLGDCSVILIFLEKWYSRAYITNQVSWTLNYIINGEFLLIVFVCHFRIMRVTYFQAISNLLHCASQPAFTYSKSINTRTVCEICSKFTIKAQERCRRSHSGVFIADFELVSHIVLVFLLLTLNNQIRARSRDCIQISLEFFVSLKELICIESIMFTDIFRWYR